VAQTRAHGEIGIVCAPAASITGMNVVRSLGVGLGGLVLAVAVVPSARANNPQIDHKPIVLGALTVTGFAPRFNAQHDILFGATDSDGVFRVLRYDWDAQSTAASITAYDDALGQLEPLAPLGDVEFVDPQIDGQGNVLLSAWTGGDYIGYALLQGDAATWLALEIDLADLSGIQPIVHPFDLDLNTPQMVDGRVALVDENQAGTLIVAGTSGEPALISGRWSPSRWSRTRRGPTCSATPNRARSSTCKARHG
jgi:hypothetical protein